MSTIRMALAEAPYEPAIAQAFERIMPPGREPLRLFRTMARSPRVLQRMFAGSLLDKGSISLRERELVILRTCARCRSEYEWGVHVAFFGQHVGMNEAEIAATRIAPEAGPWNARERLLLQLVDALHDHADVNDGLWQELAAEFNDEQLLELLALTGYYHTISFMTNALRLPLEGDAARFGPI